MRRLIVAILVAGAALALMPGCLCAFAQPKASPVGGPGSLSGFWKHNEYSHEGTFDPQAAVQLTVDGKLPPMLPWAAQLLDKRVKDGEAGHPYATTKSQCLPAGVPQMDFPPRVPIQILETPDQVTILYEELGFFRVIHLNGKHMDDPDPSFMGDAVGHWESDTLVVDTIGLSGRTSLDPAGMPHSDALHTVERFRRTGPKSLEILVTLDDPETFSRPWTARALYDAEPSDYRMLEYFCENNRNVSDTGGNVTVQPPPKTP